MPRHHAPLLTAIWDDPDFVALEAGPQRLYMQLLSQKRLSLCGVLPFSARNLARGCVSIDEADVLADLAVLVERDYIVVDDSTDELWVRTIVKHDPPRGARSVKGMWNDWLEIDSVDLRGRVVHSLPAEIWETRDVEPPEAAKALLNAPCEGASTSRETIENEKGAATVHRPPSTSRRPSSVVGESQHNFRPAEQQASTTTIALEEEVIALVAQQRCVGRSVSNERAYMATVAKEVREQRLAQIRELLAAGMEPIEVAYRVSAATPQPPAREPVPWCDSTCECDGTGWSESPAGMVPCPHRLGVPDSRPDADVLPLVRHA